MCGGVVGAGEGRGGGEEGGGDEVGGVFLKGGGGGWQGVCWVEPVRGAGIEVGWDWLLRDGSRSGICDGIIRSDASAAFHVDK